MPKKAKKDVKDQGPIAAAVTKHAAGQFARNNSIMLPRQFASDSSSSSFQSPEIKPVATPSSNGNPASPLLDAITSSSFDPGMSNDWGGRGAPGLAGSPGNLISLMGESPPTQPSSYEDSQAGPYGWTSPRPRSNVSLSVSPPPPVGRRPLSYHMDAQYQSPDLQAQPTPAHARRTSLHVPYGQPRTGPNPPLPHEPQPHFLGVTDLGFDVSPQHGMKAGERGYHFAFDKIPSPGMDRALGRDNVVTAGYEGGLEVYSVGKRGLEQLASLKGMRGGVHHAAILPWVGHGESRDVFPLVALVVHGPVLAPRNPDSNVDAPGGGFGEDRPGPAPKGANPVEFYQTTVEVYSLKTSKRVATLLEAPKIPISTSITSEVFRPPPPSGAFQIKADGGNIVVSSGVTGEAWVYRHSLSASQEEGGLWFKCVAKLWTTLQQPPKGEFQSEAERSRPAPRPHTRSPIIALSGRWIAYCPAAPSSQISLRAAVTVPLHSRAPGLTTVTPPQLPSVTSEVDLPISDSLMNKIMRDATQEFIQGAKWVGKQGWQAFNNYWKGPSNPRDVARSPPLGSQPWTGSSGYGNRAEPSHFPPTHGAAAPAVSKEPGIISIVDIASLGASTTVHSLATFSPPFGCSFLNFNPTGLALFTASSKGDVQTVWDLMRIHYSKSSPLQTSALTAAQNGSRVRQVAQFSRLTVARIVDVSWTKPHGERAAMVTERGTVHILEMPPSVFTWPPPRRRAPSQDPTASSTEAKHPAVSMASTAFSTALGVARPLMTRPRRSSSNVPQLTGSSLVDHASHGGKAIVATISNSLGKTGSAINQLRHNGENRASLPLTSIAPVAGCAVWLTGRKNHSLYVLGDGLVRTFPNKVRKTVSVSDRHRTPYLNRHRDFKLPGLPGDTIAAAVKRHLDPDEYLDLTDDAHEAGNNTMVLDIKRQLHKPGAESSIPQAEIESSAPYQPFHTDRRVALYLQGESQVAVHDSSADQLSALLAVSSLEERPTAAPARKKHRSPAPVVPQLKTHDTIMKPNRDGSWVFGKTLDTTRLDTGHNQLMDGESFNASSDESRALPASAIERVLQHDNENQIVITTRRRRGGGRTSEGDEDDGFFEDDCEVLDFADQRV